MNLERMLTCGHTSTVKPIWNFKIDPIGPLVRCSWCDKLVKVRHIVADFMPELIFDF